MREGIGYAPDPLKLDRSPILECACWVVVEIDYYFYFRVVIKSHERDCAFCRKGPVLTRPLSVGSLTPQSLTHSRNGSGQVWRNIEHNAVAGLLVGDTAESLATTLIYMGRVREMHRPSVITFTLLFHNVDLPKE